VVSGSNDDADDMRKRMISSIVWSTTMIASCGEAEGRLEAGGGIDALRVMARRSFWGFLRQTKRVRRCARERERERSRKGAAVRPDLTRFRSSSSVQWR
jgi:hypothetical protein